MAITKIHAIKSTLGKALAYIENPDKTEQGQYVSSYACSTLTADEEFKLCSFYGEAFRFVCKFR